MISKRIVSAFIAFLTTAQLLFPAGVLRVIRRSAAGTSIVTGQTLGADRSDFTGCLGGAYSISGSSITVTHLGRWVRAGNSQTHTLHIGSLDGGVTLPDATATLNTSGLSVGFHYAALATPVVLATVVPYYITSSETSGGDQFYDGDTTVTTVGGVTVSNGVYNSDCSSTYGSFGSIYIPTSALKQ